MKQWLFLFVSLSLLLTITSKAEATLNVAITSPTDSSCYCIGTKVDVMGKYTCDQAGYNLLFYVDGEQKASQGAGIGSGLPFSFSWDTTDVSTGPHTLTVMLFKQACDSASDSVGVVVIKVEITPSEDVACAGCDSCDVTFQLTDDSYTPGGVTWEITPGGLEYSTTENSITITPGTEGETYTITATSLDKPDCSDTAILNVVKVTVVSPGAVVDGETSGYFEADVTPGIASVSYQWCFKPKYEPSYNNPQVDFVTPNESATKVRNAWWYSRTDDPCEVSADLMEVYEPGEYDIFVEVMKGDMVCSNTSHGSLLVTYLREAGGTAPPKLPKSAWPLPDWAPEVDKHGRTNQYVITGIPDWARQDAEVTVNYSESSQFYLKILKHEQQHKTDWNEGFNDHLFYDRGEFEEIVIGLSAPTKEKVFKKYLQEWDKYIDGEVKEVSEDNKKVRDCMEFRAYSVSDEVAPQFIYQNCGRYSEKDCK